MRPGPYSPVHAGWTSSQAIEVCFANGTLLKVTSFQSAGPTRPPQKKNWRLFQITRPLSSRFLALGHGGRPLPRRCARMLPLAASQMLVVVYLRIVRSRSGHGVAWIACRGGRWCRRDFGRPSTLRFERRLNKLCVTVSFRLNAGSGSCRREATHVRIRMARNSRHCFARKAKKLAASSYRSASNATASGWGSLIPKKAGSLRIT